MGIAERKEREKLQRKTTIIEAAEKVFFAKGFDNTTMDDIAEEAELSKGTLYLYFNSKEELYKEMAIKGLKILNSLFENAIKNEPDGLCKVRGLGKAFVEFYQEHPNHHDALLYDQVLIADGKTSGDIDRRLLELKQKNNRIFIEVLQAGIKDGSLRKDLDPVKTSLVLWGEVMGVLQLMRYKGTMIANLFGVKDDEVLEYFFEFTSKALMAETTPTITLETPKKK